MPVSHLNALDLLGKQVSFSYFLGQSVGELVKQGVVTSVIVNLSSSPEILLDDQGDFYHLSEISDFKIL